jgi:hypothetical protein
LRLKPNDILVEQQLMKQFAAVIFCSLYAFGQAAYTGGARNVGSAGFFASNNCAAPNFCAYTGADIVPWGTVPNFGGATNNNATATDSSYLGHTNFDGSTFSNSSLLSPVTRLTDSVSAYGKTNVNFTAGMGGSGVFTLTNTNTSLVRIDQNSVGLVCRFYNSGVNQGHCAAPPSGWGGTTPLSGIFITTGQLSGGTCTSNCPVNDFGANSFSLTDPTVLYTFGNDEYDLSNPTAVTPYSINAATGVYSVGSTLADFRYGLPLGSNAPAWATGTSYAYGAYVTHVLNPPGGPNPEYPVYNTNAPTTYLVGDIVTPGGNGTCMYRAIIVTGQTSSTSPAFQTATPCSNDTVPDGGVTWRGTNSTAQFVYQNTGGAGTSSLSTFRWVAAPSSLAADGAMTSGSAVLTSGSDLFTAAQVGQAITVSGAGNGAGTLPLYTTVLSYQNAGSVTLAIPALHTVAGATVALTGHPDIMSGTVADSNSIVWTNVGPSYTIANKNQLWQAIGGIGRDTSYAGYTSKYGLAISTNSYGLAPTYSKYTADQGSAVWALMYDQSSNIYHLLNTLTGIWTDWSCSGGTGYNCSGGTVAPTTVGTVTAISNPLGTGQACPFFIHNEKMSSNGLYMVVVGQANVYAACNSLNNFFVWQTSPSGFNAASSMQITFHGINHWAIGANKLVAFSASGWGNTAGVFVGVYNANDVQGNNGAGTGYAPPFSVYLNPLASQSTAQTVPTSCYVTAGSDIQNPDCNLSEILDSHLSWVGDPGTDTYPACGTSFNYATLGPAFNAWQNMETCYQTYPTYPTGYAPPASYTLPSTSVGNVWQFTHTFATGTSATFSTQFQISQYSQDANWLFWSSDWDCQNGSTTGAAPTVYPGSGTYVDMLSIAAVPTNPTSVCGLPWAASTTYVVGNMIDPIEGTTGTGAVDDVFQAIYVGGPTGSTQPGPAIPNSYFSTATTPTSSAPGSTICDSASGASLNPSLPYSTSCPTGTVWQDIGPQTQRGDVFAVNLGNQH